MVSIAVIKRYSEQLWNPTASKRKPTKYVDRTNSSTTREEVGSVASQVTSRGASIVNDSSSDGTSNTSSSNVSKSQNCNNVNQAFIIY